MIYNALNWAETYPRLIYNELWGEIILFEPLFIKKVN